MKTVAVNPIEGANKLLEVDVEVPPSLRLLDHKEEIPPGHKTIRILSRQKGDERIVWDSSSLDQINEARTMFEELKRQGLRLFRVGVDGKGDESEELDEFDPTAEEIVALSMKMVGGG